MVESILKSTAIPAQPGRYPDPPTCTYAIWFDAVSADGPDCCNRIFTHDAMIELYEPQQDPAAEAALEAELNRRGIKWTKQPRYWLQSVRRYQVIYEFSHIEKRRT